MRAILNTWQGHAINITTSLSNLSEHTEKILQHGQQQQQQQRRKFNEFSFRIGTVNIDEINSRYVFHLYEQNPNPNSRLSLCASYMTNTKRITAYVDGRTCRVF